MKLNEFIQHAHSHIHAGTFSEDDLFVIHTNLSVKWQNVTTVTLGPTNQPTRWKVLGPK